MTHVAKIKRCTETIFFKWETIEKFLLKEAKITCVYWVELVSQNMVTIEIKKDKKNLHLKVSVTFFLTELLLRDSTLNFSNSYV